MPDFRGLLGRCVVVDRDGAIGVQRQASRLVNVIRLIVLPLVKLQAIQLLRPNAQAPLGKQLAGRDAHLRGARGVIGRHHRRIGLVHLGAKALRGVQLLQQRAFHRLGAGAELVALLRLADGALKLLLHLLALLLHVQLGLGRAVAIGLGAKMVLQRLRVLGGRDVGRVVGHGDRHRAAGLCSLRQLLGHGRAGGGHLRGHARLHQYLAVDVDGIDRAVLGRLGDELLEAAGVALQHLAGARQLAQLCQHSRALLGLLGLELAVFGLVDDPAGALHQRHLRAAAHRRGNGRLQRGIWPLSQVVVNPLVLVLRQNKELVRVLQHRRQLLAALLAQQVFQRLGSHLPWLEQPEQRRQADHLGAGLDQALRAAEDQRWHHADTLIARLPVGLAAGVEPHRSQRRRHARSHGASQRRLSARQKGQWQLCQVQAQRLKA